MKENYCNMDYEKKYKEALERMKSWARGEHPECFSEAQKAAEFIFPELKKSEGERIRKAIIEFFELQDDNTTYFFVPKKDILDWLEKQGDNKKLDADKVIEWLENKIKETVKKSLKSTVNCGIYRQIRLTLPYESLEYYINDFKEDFGLC